MDISAKRTRSRRWHLVTPGAYARIDAGRVAVLAAWQSKLPPDAAFTHLTAVELWGWWMPELPPGVPVFAQMSPRHRIRRRGLRVIRVEPCREHRTRYGLRVAAPEDVLLACARDFGVLDLAVVVDGALHAGVPRARIEAAANERRAGAPALRAALSGADARSESAWETLLRIQHETFGVPVVPQHRVVNDGVFIARGDLWIPRTRTLQEYDGAVHRDRGQHHADLDRDRRLSAIGWTRNGFTKRDLTRRPAVDAVWNPSSGSENGRSAPLTAT
ncbi:hypothetical protein [Nocardioides massiliensis]|uniref:Very-short-patch-repair endonuclease n=1 Tax=Nocardioides massiliensis TaxID=1325935 RepID=A0ABT9NPA1_9ACTN|nr:hypothetical protein [Nocardioides massiliensis]MDP9822234.1 very-short-patch-repair endonuclease [Nocardioides massiliensis]